ncbi:MAG: Uma2 family endonuclease [Pseudonocardia sp.]|nr:Uma2 family endonuclease [Pseudonocardia sp.]
MPAARVPGLLTAADLSHEPEDGLRRELHDGVIYVVPPPADRHSWEINVAYHALLANAPDDVYLLQNVGVHVGLRRLYVPDLTVVHRDTPFHDNGYDPGGVLLVVETVSPSSVTLDRITKPAVYAEQGIPFYWRIDDGPRLHAYRLDDDVNLRRAELGPGEKGLLTEPWPISVDMAEFVMPHERE